MTNAVGLDFETYSPVDLTVHGLDRYMAHPHFKVLRAGVVTPHGQGGVKRHDLDMVNYESNHSLLWDLLEDKIIVAHNVPFESGVLKKLGIEVDLSRFRDSAVVARAVGGGSKLEAAAPQLLSTDKMESGMKLIRVFSIPGKYQEVNGSTEFDPQITHDRADEWKEFGEYCVLDAELGLMLYSGWGSLLLQDEHVSEAITLRMNETGWPVDVHLVELMKDRYEENLRFLESRFRRNHNAQDLNLNSLKQLKEWCADRGIKASSFDQQNVERLIKAIDKKLGTLQIGDPKFHDYDSVLAMLHTKRELGGSALKKLDVILNNVSEDGRLRDQYVHCGAGQTLRASGRSVQMQNLKRLDQDNILDMADVMLMTNDQLAENMRQLFAAEHEDGELIVGDFSSVESRGLSWLAGAQWKLKAFREGLDLYKVQAQKIFNITYLEVGKSERQTGKVGELSCGYGAGAGAVGSFAAGMGVMMTEDECKQLVTDWRDANPEVVLFWEQLNKAMHQALVTGIGTVRLLNGWSVQFNTALSTPQSLVDQVPGAKSMWMELFDQHGQVQLRRVFHGVYMRGRNVGYHKPSKLKTGDLWKHGYFDPKTKEFRYYELYGGKLAGILTQSLCREIFYGCLQRVDTAFSPIKNVKVVGQFHDEIVLEWTPKETGSRFHEVSLAGAKDVLERCMSDEGPFTDFPLAADIKSAHRYIK